MKSKEEIIEICRGIIDEETISPVYEDAVFDGIVMGYTRCQEDMKKEMYEFGKKVLDTFHSEGKTNSGDVRLARIKYHEWFNGL